MDCKAPWVAQQCYSVISLMEIFMEQQDVSLTSQLDDFFVSGRNSQCQLQSPNT
jgi:hypothetical protein